MGFLPPPCISPCFYHPTPICFFYAYLSGGISKPEYTQNLLSPYYHYYSILFNKFIEMAYGGTKRNKIVTIQFGISRCVSFHLIPSQITS